MHILYLTGGGHVHDYRFLYKLVEYGHRVSYVCLLPGREDVGVEGLEHYFIGTGGRAFTPAGRWLSRLAAFWRFRRLVRRLRPDVVHAGWLPSSGLMAAASGYRPLLVTPWGSDILRDPARDRWSRSVARFVLGRADAVFANSQAMTDAVLRVRPGARLARPIVPWGIDLRLFYPAGDGERARFRSELGLGERPTIIVTRAHAWVYGLPDFLHALERVAAAMPDVLALLISGGPDTDALRRQTANAGLDGNVRFVGYVPNAAMRSYFTAADVYATTSYSDTSSLSLLEAMACGLPAVATDAPSNDEWVEHCVGGYVVPRRDIDAIAGALLALLRDGDGRRAMGDHNRRVAVERADWDKNYEVVEGIYQRLASGE